MITINPYLYFNGNCEEAFEFYKSVFEAEFKYIGRYKDVQQSDKHIFREQGDKIMHVSLPISKETILMGADNTQLYHEAVSNNTFSLSINTDEKELAEKLFQKLAKGGRIKLAMKETFWGSYYGIVHDKFGINWKISFEAS
ncbi:VOC family protein [Flavobacterium aestuarii]|uniref:VOC family protein n=1 Tax=Flavobacterium aestuarii TaxID=3149227 RepID=UPI0032B5AC9E